MDFLIFSFALPFYTFYCSLRFSGVVGKNQDWQKKLRTQAEQWQIAVESSATVMASFQAQANTCAELGGKTTSVCHNTECEDGQEYCTVLVLCKGRTVHSGFLWHGFRAWWVLSGVTRRGWLVDKPSVGVSTAVSSAVVGMAMSFSGMTLTSCTHRCFSLAHIIGSQHVFCPNHSEGNTVGVHWCTEDIQYVCRTFCEAAVHSTCPADKALHLPNME